MESDTDDEYGGYYGGGGGGGGGFGGLLILVASAALLIAIAALVVGIIALKKASHYEDYTGRCDQMMHGYSDMKNEWWRIKQQWNAIDPRWGHPYPQGKYRGDYRGDHETPSPPYHEDDDGDEGFVEPRMAEGFYEPRERILGSERKSKHDRYAPRGSRLGAFADRIAEQQPAESAVDQSQDAEEGRPQDESQPEAVERSYACDTVEGFGEGTCAGQDLTELGRRAVEKAKAQGDATATRPLTLRERAALATGRMRGF